MTKIGIVFFNLEKNIPLVKEISSYYQGSENYGMNYFNKLADTTSFLEASGNGIVIFKIASKEDLSLAVSVLKSNLKQIKKGVVKPVCIYMVKNKKVEQILHKYGCSELIEPDIKGKTLTFKIEFWAKAIKTYIKKNEHSESLKIKQSDSVAQAQKNQQKKNDFELVPALDLPSDMFLFQSKSDYKKILRRWLLRVTAPSPEVGHWVELEPQPNDKLPTWRWTFRHPDDQQFMLDDGAWFFYGSKPEFDWKINKWNFSSDQPHLYFYTRDEKVYSRFKMEKGCLLIAENSEYAKTKEQMIIESFDRNYSFSKDGESPDIQAEFEQDNQLRGAGNLEGEIETDHLDAGPLKGSVDGTDYIEDDEHRLENDFQDNGPLRGSLDGTDRLEDDEHSLENDFSDSGPLKGRLDSSDRLDRNPLKGKSSTDRLEDDEHSLENDFKDSGPLSGNAETDELSQGPLKGKLSQNRHDERADIDPLFAEKRPAQRDESYTEEEEDSSPVPTIKTRGSIGGEIKDASGGAKGKLDFRSERESSLDELLGGKLTDDSDVLKDELEDLEHNNNLALGKNDFEFEEEINLNLESGEVKCLISLISSEGNPITFLSSFEDYFDNEMVVNVPINSLSEGNEVDIKLQMNYSGKKVNIHTTGVIEAIEEHDEKKEKLIIKTNNMDEKKMEHFLSLFGERQTAIMDFMKQAKGL